MLELQCSQFFKEQPKHAIHTKELDKNVLTAFVANSRLTRPVVAF